MKEIIVNCSNGDITERDLSNNEITQHEIEANTPEPPVPKSEIEILKETVDLLILSSLGV